MSITKIIEKHFGTDIPEALRPFISDITQYCSTYENTTTDQDKGTNEFLARSEEKYKSVLENMELGLIEIDLEGKISYVHDYFCKMTGYSKEELIGKLAIEKIITEKFRINFVKQFQPKKKGKSGPYEMQIHKKNGKPMWILIGSIPLYNDNHRVNGSLGICLNITRQKKVEKRLIEAMQKAEDSAKAKEQFLANMSHEIRTPMNAIVGMGSLLRKTTLNPKQQKYLSAITSSADNLLVIINDILDLSKVESGKVVFEKIGFRVSEVVERVKASLSYKAQEKGIQILMQPGKHTDNIVKGDPTRLNQVLLNLVNNAIKFTPKGNVTILCHIQQQQASHIRFGFTVQDTGIGIAPDKFETIFDSFSQADAGTTRQYGGTGLGLAICKKLVEAQGGTIEVKSVLHQGTSFTFVLDFEKGTESDLPFNPEDSYDTYDLSQLRILLAEDNKFNQMLVVSLAEEWGCHIDAVENGSLALQKLYEQPYDLVLMDMQMPVMDGIEATKAIRNHTDKAIQRIPIIALTANSFASDTRKCLTAGMNDYLSKPFESLALYKKIAQLTSHKLKQVVQQVNAAPILLCKEGLLYQMAAGNVAFTVQMLELFITEVGTALQEMHTLKAAHSLTGIKRLAHKIKPSIDSIAPQDARQLIRKVETNLTEENAEMLIAQLTDTTDRLFDSCRLEIIELQARS